MSDAKITGWMVLGTVFLLTVTAYMQYLIMQEQDASIARVYAKLEGLETAINNVSSTKKEGSPSDT